MESNTASSILDKGTVVFTKITNSMTWSSNVVYSCKDNKLLLYMLQDYLDCLIATGTNISIKYSNQYFEYILNGVVKEIILEQPGLVDIDITKINEIVNYRDFPRLDKNMALSIYRDATQKPEFGISSNISLSGMAFNSTFEYEINDKLKILINLPNSHNVILKGTIIRKHKKEARFEYSMMFIEMDEKNNSLLHDYINEQYHLSLEIINTYYYNAIK